MSILNRLKNFLGISQKSSHNTYEFSESLQVTLKTLAEQEGRTEDELIPDLLAAGLTQYQSVEKLWNMWEGLSPREKQVTALTCLGLTNRQIAGRLALSPETIKTHVRNVLLKFGLSSKEKLRHILAGWDFSGWM
jgi:DNA-binding CsgD family transcriptional regulator